MKILVINCGSSSLKYQLIDMEGEKVLCKGLCERIGIEGSKITHKANGGAWTEEVPFPTHTEAFSKVVEMMTTGEGAVVKDKSEIGAIGHRVVQGAEFFTKSEIVTDAIIDKIEEIAPLAPVHNMAHVQGLRSAKKVFGAEVPNVVVFDTTFHQTMPPKAYMYGVPYEMYEKYAIRRYGAHGTSHRFVSMAAAKYLGRDDLKMVTCHLGNGSSITAVNCGKCVDTSMGLTPLAGVLMGTRCGDIDPSVVTYMEQKLGIHGQEMADYLKALEPEEWHNEQEKIRQLMPYKLPAKLVEYLKTGPLRLEFPDQEWVKWAELYSFMDVQEMTWKRKKLLSLMVQMDNYSDYLLLWSPRDKKLWYLDIEHEEFHPLTKWDDFIADPGRYLNGMIEGEFEE